jgi:hypothetical protein
MITARVFKLNQDAVPRPDFDFKKGQEFEIVTDVVYMNGFPLPIDMQRMFYTWITQNQNLFSDDTRQW